MYTEIFKICHIFEKFPLVHLQKSTCNYSTQAAVCKNFRSKIFMFIIYHSQECHHLYLTLTLYSLTPCERSSKIRFLSSCEISSSPNFTHLKHHNQYQLKLLVSLSCYDLQCIKYYNLLTILTDSVFLQLYFVVLCTQIQFPEVKEIT